MSKFVPDSCCQVEIPREFLDFASLTTVTDLEKNMGEGLVDVYLKTCSPIELVLLGRDKSLKGPGKLWIDPENRSSGQKVQLTPLWSETVQALTHHEILDIGRKFEDKLNDENAKTVEAAVDEAEKLSKFETNQQIKFHVDNTTKMLLEEFDTQLESVKQKHEDEKKLLRGLYETASEMLRNFIAKKCDLETKKLIAKAIVETKEEMETQFSKVIQNELAQQTILFNEQMENTMKNLKIDDRNRMEELKRQCLSAMDVQAHLMVIRQVSELMHMMTVEKHFWRDSLSDSGCETLINESKPPTDDIRDHQSKSLKHLWIKFLRQLDACEGEHFDEEEKRIFHEIQQIEVMMKQQRGVHGMFENRKSNAHVWSEGAKTKATSDSSMVIDDKTCISSGEKAPFIHVSWEKLENNFGEKAVGETFTGKLQQFLQPQSCRPEIASSINKIMKKLREKQVDKSTAKMILDVMVEEFSSINAPSSTAVEFVPMPATDALHINDSMVTLAKRVSLPEDPVENLSAQLLSTIDSLELISTATSHYEPKTTSVSSVASRTSVSLASSSEALLPPYMKSPKKSCRKKFAKMTEEDWNKVNFPQAMTSERESSVHFVDNETLAPKSFRRSSISRRSAVDEKNHPYQRQSTSSHQENALEEIHQKCRDALNGMTIESLLLKMCGGKPDRSTEATD